jgi:hypothetical protein
VRCCGFAKAGPLTSESDGGLVATAGSTGRAVWNGPCFRRPSAYHALVTHAEQRPGDEVADEWVLSVDGLSPSCGPTAASAVSWGMDICAGGTPIPCELKVLPC